MKMNHKNLIVNKQSIGNGVLLSRSTNLSDMYLAVCVHTCTYKRNIKNTLLKCMDKNNISHAWFASVVQQQIKHFLQATNTRPYKHNTFINQSQVYGITRKLLAVISKNALCTLLKCGRNNLQKDTTSARSARTKAVYRSTNLDTLVMQEVQHCDKFHIDAAFCLPAISAHSHRLWRAQA